MIKNQSIVDLWISSGKLLDDIEPGNEVVNLEEYNLMLARLDILCKASHDETMTKVIPKYTKRGWIK